MPPVRIAVLSDDQLYCEGLRRIVGGQVSFIVVGHDDKAAWRPSLRQARPDVLLVDSRMEGALALCAGVERGDRPAIVFISAAADDDWARGALEAGARGILAKSAGAEELVKAIRVVHEGQIWARRHVIAACMDRAAGASGGRPEGERVLEQRLSQREREIFRQAATGLSNKELADRLAISEATVKAHLTRIFQKLGLRGRAELAAAYHGIISSTPSQDVMRNLPRRA